jgi:ribosomal protein S18 acetylase RimI-like enzyme
MRVRQASVADAPDVARLLHDFNTEFDEPTPGVEFLAGRIEELIEAGEVLALLAGDGPDGFAVVRFRPSLWTNGLDAYLEELYVVPDERGHGLGRALLEAAMAASGEAGAAHIDLTTSEDDTAALGLYTSAGFVNREHPPDGPVMLYFERDL